MLVCCGVQDLHRLWVECDIELLVHMGMLKMLGQWVRIWWMVLLSMCMRGTRMVMLGLAMMMMMGVTMVPA